jgi:hypothetical protein
VLAIVALCAALPAAIEPRRFFVETSSLSEGLGLELAKEMQRADRAEDADVVVKLDRAGSDLVLEVREPSAEAPMLVRHIDATGGSLPALRVAVLLVREAMRALENAVPPEESPRVMAIVPTASVAPSESPFHVDVEVRSTLFSSSFRPARAELGLGAMVRVAYGPFGGEAGVEASPGLCCDLSTEQLDVHGSDVVYLIGGSVELLELVERTTWVSLAIDTGLDDLRVTAQAKHFAAQNPPQSFRALLWLVEVSPSIRWRLADHWHVSARVGLRATGQFQVSLPDLMGGFSPQPVRDIVNVTGGIGVAYAF